MIEEISTARAPEAVKLAATALSGERTAELGRWLEAKRSLVFSGDVDGAYLDLYRYATSTSEGEVSILKLRLKDSSDEAYHRQELQRILRDGGTLVLDLRGADPKLIKEWNSLYDFDAAGKGVQQISKHLRIIALADKDAPAPPESVTSRSAKFYDQSNQKKIDPLSDLSSVPDEAASSINLHQDADPKTWRYELLGSQRRQGALIEALQKGVTLEIKNAPLDQSSKAGAYDAELANLLRQVVIEKRIMHNNEWVYAQSGFELRLTYTNENIPAGLKIQAEDESNHSDTRAGKLSTFYVNSHTVGMLFSRTVINNGKLQRRTGLLDIRPENGAAPIKFVITQDLPLGKWNKLLSHPALHDAGVSITVAVKDGVSIPKKYRELQSETLQSRVRRRGSMGNTPEPVQLKEISSAISDKKVVLVRSELDLAHAEINKQLGDISPVYVQLTPYRSDEELWEGVKVDRENKKFVLERTRALKTLLDPRGVVILSGVDSRSDFFNEQPGLTASEPYLLVHGRVVSIVGKLILVERPSAIEKALSIEKREHLEVSSKLFKQLQKFTEALATIPAHSGAVDKELYPSQPRTNLNKIRVLIAQYKSCKDWASAADLVFGGDYGLHPEARAFIRVQARRIFESETKKSPAINSHVITAVQDSSGELAESSSHMWRLLDSLNGAAVKQVEISGDFTAKLSDHDVAWRVIKRSLCDYSREDHRKMYQDNFVMKESATGEPSIAINFPKDTKSAWTKMRDISIDLLTRDGIRPQVLFLQGAPGRGKSHLIRDIRAKLQGSRKMFGPLTANPDMVFKSDQLDRLLKDWRGSLGGVLLIDEGNLLPKHFWDRLREDLLADPQKAIVFSGNETFQAGRQPIALAEELGVTLFFEQFSDSERASMIDTYTEGLTNKVEAAKLILELTGFLENNQFGKSFTPRDLQEVCDWARFFGSSKEQLIMHVWRVYSPVFSREQQNSLSVFIKLRYGVDPGCSIKEAGADTGAATMHAMRAEFKERYRDPMRQSGFVLQDESLAVATELAKIVELSRKRGGLNLAEGGKRGVIIEAESGWGKDFTAVKTIETLGFVRGEPNESDIGNIPLEGAKRYYVINAELDFTTLERTINRAAREGAVLIIREANALDAGVLEAQVNDILTGNAKDVHPAFLTVMTVNSADVESMSAFSSALLSRVHHIKARPHSRETLEAMVGIAEPNLDKKVVSQITGLHLYLRDIAKVEGRRPNTRDLLRAASEARCSEDAWPHAVIESYLFYIEHGIAGVEAVKGAHQFLRDKAERYVAKSDIVPARIMKALTQVALPRYVGEIDYAIDPGCFEINADGYFEARDGSADHHRIGISPRAIKMRSWPRVILHEARHALNDCGMGISYGDLEQDIRDLRNQASFATLVPEAKMMELTLREATLLRELKSGFSYRRAGSERDFRELMALIAKTNDEQLTNLELLDCFLGLFGDASSYRAIIAIAVKHFGLIREISSCFAARNFGGGIPSLAELHAKQVRLTEIVGTIYEDYKNLPEEVWSAVKRGAAGSNGGSDVGADDVGHDGLSRDSYDPAKMLQELEDSCGIPRSGLLGPEDVTHESSGGAEVSVQSAELILLNDPGENQDAFEAPELSENAKRILAEARSRAATSDSSPWQAPKELWEEVVSEWSESSVSNGRRSDPAGSLQLEELFGGKRPEDARVSPGAEVNRERKVIRLAEVSNRFSAEDLGLIQELLRLGFTVAIGDKEAVSSLVALCIQEQARDAGISKEELSKRLTPAAIKSAAVMTLHELKTHLEGIAAYAALNCGVALLEQKQSGKDIGAAKKINWPKLTKAQETGELVLHYLEEDGAVLAKLDELTKDLGADDATTKVNGYMERLAGLLTQEDTDQEEDPDYSNRSEIEIALKILDSYNYNEATGESVLTIPRGVTYAKAMRAINSLFRYESLKVLISETDIEDRFEPWSWARSLDTSRREIRLTAIVEDTGNLTRSEQEIELKKRSMKFAQENDIVLIVAAHFWNCGGARLLPFYSYVRCSKRDWFVHVDEKHGILVVHAGNWRDQAAVGIYASGTPSS